MRVFGWTDDQAEGAGVKEYKRNMTGSIGILVCWTAFDLIISTFLLAEILYATGGDIAKVALFNVVLFGCHFMFFFALSFVAKRWSCKWVIRLGIAVNVILTCLLCVSSIELLRFYLLFAVINGAARGIFWTAMNQFASKAMGGKKMAAFQAYLIVATSAASIIFPFTLGAVIKSASFFIAAIISVGVGAVCVAFSMLLREHGKGERFDPLGFFRYIRENKLVRPVMHNFAIQYTRMFYRNVAAVCVVVLIVMSFGDSFSLGWLTSAFGAGAILVAFGYRWLRPGRVKTAVFCVASLLMFGLSLGLLFEINTLTILLFQFGAVVLMVIPNIETAKLQIDYLRELGHKKFLAESMVFSEFAYWVSQVPLFAIMFVLVKTGSLFAFQILVVCLMALAAVNFILVKLWYKMYITKH